MTATAIVNPTLAEVSKLSVSYRSGGRDISVLSDICLHLQTGQALALVGESGCGKSTLAGALVGFMRSGSQVGSGSIKIAGQDILGASPQVVRQLRRGQVGFVPQNAGHSLTPSMRVGDQVVEVLRTTRGMARDEARAEAIRLFGQVRLPEPATLIDRYSHQLSGGQQQRVAVAIALAGQPRLLVLDEPTTGLDVVTQAGLLALIGRLRVELGFGVVMVSHDLGAVATVCERIAVMYAGRIVEQGNTKTIFAKPSHPYTRGLLASVPRLSAPGLPAGMAGSVAGAGSQPGCSFAPRCDFVQPGCTEGGPPLLLSVARQPDQAGLGDQAALGDQAGLGDQAAACLRVDAVLAAPAWQSQVRPRRQRERGEPLLSVKGLEVDYRRRPEPGSGPTVWDVDIAVHRGEVVALVGESGSGKSTIAWTIAGLRTPTAGQITLAEAGGVADLGKAAARRDPSLRRQVQLIFQNASTALNPRRSAGDAISRPLRLRGLRGADVGSARDLALADVGLETNQADRLPGQLSGGQQQRVGIARALAAGPTLVLADEVVSALDVSVQASVLRLLDDLRSEHELGYLFISHDLAVVRGIADWVVVLYLGRVCEEGPVERVFADVTHPYTRLLVGSVLATTVSAATVIDAPVTDDEPECAPPAAGCWFRGRCVHRIEGVCDNQTPPWQVLGDGHRVRCHVPVAELRVAPPHVTASA